jgi:glucokinase
MAGDLGGTQIRLSLVSLRVEDRIYEVLKTWHKLTKESKSLYEDLRQALKEWDMN